LEENKKYCREHKDGDFCKLTNRRKAPKVFCEMICHGDFEKYHVEDVEVLRQRHRKPISDIKLTDDMVTVIIPCYMEQTWMVQRTVDSLLENARGPIEIYVVYDGECGEHIGGATVHRLANRVGQRVITNMVAGQTTGKYIMRMDGHCLMSPDWDARMKESCVDGTLVTTCFDTLDKDFNKVGQDNAFVKLFPTMREKFGRNWKSIPERQTEEETMTITGTAFMMNRSDFYRLGGHDISLGVFGGIGAEWALKFWLTGGRVIIRTDVVCYHHFRFKTPYEVNVIKQEWAYGDLYRQFVKGENKMCTRPFEWLLLHFSNWVKWPEGSW